MDIGVFAEVITSRLAGVASSAGNIIRRDDTIANLHRLSHAIRLHAFTELIDLSDEFVSLTSLFRADSHRGGTQPVFNV